MCIDDIFDVVKKREQRCCQIIGEDYRTTDDEIRELVGDLVENYKIYSSYNEFYQEYRWFKYNLFDLSLLGKKNVDITNINYLLSYQLNKYPKIVERGLKNFKNNNFNVKTLHLTDYEEEYVRPLLSDVINRPLNFFGFTIEFIESLKSPLNPDKPEYLDNVKERLIYYFCWDKMSKDELINRLSLKIGGFLNSTIKLVGKDKIKNYLNSRFHNKDQIIEILLSNLVLDDEWRNQIIREQVDSDFYFVSGKIDDYQWFFNNEVKRSIRLFENEIRIDNGVKIIGSFYNEDLLYKTLLNEFGDKYNVVSQGSPDWLRPQRLDVYFPDINVGVEYQGEQHYRPVDFGGKGKRFSNKQFKKNQQRDELKKKKCEENNCVLLEMKYNDDLSKFLNKVHQVIKEF